MIADQSSLLRRRRAALAALAAPPLLALASCATTPLEDAAPLTPAQAGRELAQRECASCHAITELGRRQGGARGERSDGYAGLEDEPPPLRDVLDRYSPNRLKMAFQEGMIVGHMEMPVYKLSDEETDALLAYLQSIRG